MAPVELSQIQLVAVRILKSGESAGLAFIDNVLNASNIFKKLTQKYR